MPVARHTCEITIEKATPGERATGTSTSDSDAARLDACTQLAVAEAACGDANVVRMVSQSTRMNMTNGVTENSWEISLERVGERHTATGAGDTQQDACDDAAAAACKAAGASPECTVLLEYRVLAPEAPRRSLFTAPR